MLEKFMLRRNCNRQEGVEKWPIAPPPNKLNEIAIISGTFNENPIDVKSSEVYSELK